MSVEEAKLYSKEHQIPDDFSNVSASGFTSQNVFFTPQSNGDDRQDLPSNSGKERLQERKVASSGKGSEISSQYGGYYHEHDDTFDSEKQTPNLSSQEDEEEEEEEEEEFSEIEENTEKE